MGKLVGKTSLITGAASGFGKGMALRFAEEGSDIIMFDLDSEGMNETSRQIQEINSECRIFTSTIDVSDFESVSQGVNTLLESRPRNKHPC